MNTKLSAVSDKRMDLTCSACGQEFSYKIADLILATSDNTESEARRAMPLPPPMRYVREPCVEAVVSEGITTYVVA